MKYQRSISRRSIGKRFLIVCLVIAVVMFLIGAAVGYGFAVWRMG